MRTEESLTDEASACRAQPARRDRVPSEAAAEVLSLGSPGSPSPSGLSGDPVDPCSHCGARLCQDPHLERLARCPRCWALVSQIAGKVYPKIGSAP